MYAFSNLRWFTLLIVSFHCFYNEFAFLGEKMSRVKGEAVKGPCFVRNNASKNKWVESSCLFTFIGGHFCGIKRTLRAAASLDWLSMSLCSEQKLWSQL